MGVTDAQQDEIHPFPKDVAGPASELIALLSTSRGAKFPRTFDVTVRGERVAIPQRIYLDEQQLLNCAADRRPFADCLLTRHHDGFVRARALDRIIGLNKPWSIPFVVQLVGEYVVEILDQIDIAFDRIDLDVMADFVRENPAFIQLTTRRVVSYWNCYYRERSARADYVGFRLINRLENARRDETGGPWTAIG